MKSIHAVLMVATILAARIVECAGIIVPGVCCSTNVRFCPSAGDQADECIQQTGGNAPGFCLVCSVPGAGYECTGTAPAAAVACRTGAPTLLLPNGTPTGASCGTSRYGTCQRPWGYWGTVICLSPAESSEPGGCGNRALYCEDLCGPVGAYRLLGPL